VVWHDWCYRGVDVLGSCVVCCVFVFLRMVCVIVLVLCVLRGLCMV